MTIMSIILIILLLLILISKKTFNYKVILTLSLATLFEIFVSVGYFLQIGSLEVNHTEFLYIFCVILMIFQNVSTIWMTDKLQNAFWICWQENNDAAGEMDLKNRIGNLEYFNFLAEAAA